MTKNPEPWKNLRLRSNSASQTNYVSLTMEAMSPSLIAIELLGGNFEMAKLNLQVLARAFLELVDLDLLNTLDDNDDHSALVNYNDKGIHVRLAQSHGQSMKTFGDVVIFLMRIVRTC